MRATDFRVLRKMEVRCVIFKLLLFQILVAWCGAKNIELDSMGQLRVELPTDVEAEVQSSIRNLVHNGIYSHQHLDPSKAQVVTPVKVTRDGALVSRTLDHDHGHGHARSRRDLHLRDHKMDHVLHYNLTVDGKDLRLDLRPSVTFITPAMVVERHTTTGRSRHQPLEAVTGCHYTGSVRGQPLSSVALSACDGLAGMLRTEQGEYWIEPSNQKTDSSLEGRPHVIFRRSAVDKVEAWHRSKRSVDTNYRFNNNPERKSYSNNRLQKYSRRSNRRYDSKEIQDRRRREHLEARRKKLQELRKNPAEYKRYLQRQQYEQKARLANRTNTQSHSSSASNSNSVELSRSLETRNRTRNNTNKNHKRRPNKGRRRRRRQSKNCATKQPPYLWEKANYDKKMASQRYRNKMHRRYPHHHQLSHYPDFEETRRSTRSVSKPRHVEVLLVADKSMNDFHEEDHLETYLLTIMNMVSSLYMDPSIGNYIKVVVVKIILVEEMQAAPELNVSTNADSTLESFCSWQHRLNPDSDANPHHHDVAILVTRKDICSQHDTPCSTLGVANVAGMCKPDISCSVNEDNGIMLAHTITHELGHNFGLYHDTEKIGCHRREGSTLHIMTPVFESDTVQVAWSRCSKRDVTNFLDTGAGECLGDTPSQEYYKYPEVPAGVTFDAAAQCHLQFGLDAVVCTNPAELCEHLWCSVNNACKTMLRPAAAGTTCGENMWCQKQKCVFREPTPEPQDGGWGEWGAWSECSRTCGAGVSTQTRLCDSPEPSNNGKYCIGERSRHKICNTDPCPIGEPSYRSVQCNQYQMTWYHNESSADWIPYYDHDKPCELQCSNGNIEKCGFVADGTPCRQTDDSRDMCIEGVCHKVGCDWVVDSEAEEDACGVCGGDGSACKTVKGIYNKDTGTGFSEVAVIPAGSRNVNIQEKVNPGNYISIRSAKSKKLYISGARNEALTEYFVAGSQAIYERNRDWEKVRIPGPIKEDIRVYQHLYRGKKRNPMVSYKYTVDEPRGQRRFHYKLSEWSACSVTCGIGQIRRHLQCYDEHERLVNQSQCYSIEPPRGDAMMEQCRMPACHPTVPEPQTHWWVGGWMSCSRSCRMPKEGAMTDRCRMPACHPTAPEPQTHWWVGGWMSCSRSCRMPGEEPTKQRSVYCVDKKQNSIVDASACDPLTRPNNSIKCADVPPC